MTNGLSLEELMKEETYPEEYAEGENWKILHGDTTLEELNRQLILY